jgi:hypothetical protein
MSSVHDLELRAAQAYDRVRHGNDYDAWVHIALGLHAGRDWVAYRAGTTDYQSTAYRQALAQWEARNQWALGPELSPPTDSHCLWLAENLHNVEAWRAGLNDAERLAFDHPSTIWRHYHRKGPRRSGGRRASPAAANTSHLTKAAFDALKDALDKALVELAAKDQEIAQLKANGLNGYPEFPLLWLKPPLTEEAVRAAHRRMARACHPDAGGSHEQMTALNLELQRALKAAQP